MGEDLKLVAGMLKCRLHKAMMTPAQLDLYNRVSETMTSDMQKQETTFTIPANADSKDLKKVERQIKLEGGYWPVKFVTGVSPGGLSPGAGNNPKPKTI